MKNFSFAAIGRAYAEQIKACQRVTVGALFINDVRLHVSADIDALHHAAWLYTEGRDYNRAVIVAR